MALARNARRGPLDQVELQFEELESSATEDEIAAEVAVAKTTTLAVFTRSHLPRERVIVSDRQHLLRGQPTAQAG
jgi:hypothetical protein